MEVGERAKEVKRSLSVSRGHVKPKGKRGQAITLHSVGLHIVFGHVEPKAQKLDL
jgi:hypothetical protein